MDRKRTILAPYDSRAHQARIERNLSQVQLAEIAGVPRLCPGTARGRDLAEPSTRVSPELEFRLAELESKVQAIQGGRRADRLDAAAVPMSTR